MNQLLLRWRITRNKYEEIRKESEEKQKELEKKITELSETEREYYMTVSFLVELGSRSSDIFKRSKPHEKRALLNFVLSNRELDGEKVLYTAKFPFNMVLKYAPRSKWLPVHELIRNLHQFIMNPDIFEAKMVNFSAI